MSDYTVLTDFAAKDSLITGNPSKLVKGVDFGAEFTAISTAIATKPDETSGTLTTPTINTPAFNNTSLSGIKVAQFNGEVNNATTTGAVTIDWTTGACQKQAEPTGIITYTFTAPTTGVARLQLRIVSDGTSTAYTHVWPGSVIWLGATWAQAANKTAIITFFYDGTNYFASGANQV